MRLKNLLEHVMTRYPDGSILVTPDELSGVDGLINAISMYHLDKGDAFMNDDVIKFVNKWIELSVSRESAIYRK